MRPPFDGPRLTVLRDIRKVTALDRPNAPVAKIVCVKQFILSSVAGVKKGSNGSNRFAGFPTGTGFRVPALGSPD
jgi:hypothetical protein